MNTYFLVFVVAQAMLLQSISAGCIRSNRIITGPTIISAPYIPTYVSAPIVPILPSTTIVQTNSVTNSLVDVLSMLPVVSLLSDQLCPNYITPVYSSCSCGCGPYIF